MTGPWPGLRDPSFLDPGIRSAVVLLNEAGIETFESCEGGVGHAYAEPTVRFEGDEQRGMRALALCEAAELPARRLSLTWSVREMEHSRAAGQPVPRPFCEITFRTRPRGSTHLAKSTTRRLGVALRKVPALDLLALGTLPVRVIHGRGFRLLRPVIRLRHLVPAFPPGPSGHSIDPTRIASGGAR